MNAAMDRYRQQVEEAVRFLAGRIAPPRIVLALGTGLGGLVDRLATPRIVPYREIPHFPLSTAPSHAGNLVQGALDGVEVTVLQGRVHYYEGYSARRVGFAMRVLALLGAEVCILTNAVGGLDPAFRPGSLMLVTDHINLLPDNPLRGPNVAEWGERFVDLSSPYSERLLDIARRAGEEIGEPLAEGTYVCVPGPSLETPAETRFLQVIGGQAVAMSMLPEILTARHAGVEVLAVSVIANVNDPGRMQPILLEEIVASAQPASGRLLELLARIVREV